MNIQSLQLQGKNIIIVGDDSFVLRAGVKGISNFKNPIIIPKKDLKASLLDLLDNDEKAYDEFLAKTFADLGRDYSFNNSELEAIQTLLQQVDGDNKLICFNSIRSRLLRSHLSTPILILKMFRAIGKYAKSNEVSAKYADYVDVKNDIELIKAWSN
ncbi:hypothetical protein [Acinetobacter sp. P1(2025)]|uniref:hypothetical protein n=1 Tax=Acinetobacter sp. P1(2025) TaxID=3446120 RepID=UPI003F52A91E